MREAGKGGRCGRSSVLIGVLEPSGIAFAEVSVDMVVFASEVATLFDILITLRYL